MNGPVRLDPASTNMLPLAAISPLPAARPAVQAADTQVRRLPLRLQVLSDLHADVVRTASPRLIPGADVVVVAGDTCQGCVDAFRYLCASLPDVPIVMVAGNHEHYGRTLPDELAEARRRAPEFGIAFLEDGVAIVCGVRFVGATLWTDYCLDGVSRQSAAMNTARHGMNDHRRITMSRQPWSRFRPEDALATHQASRRFIDATLAVPFAGPTVVVTHHAPHPGSIAPCYRGDSLNGCFASDLSATILAGQPALWIHGHVHASFDYSVGRTRILCNPHGYGRENPAYDPALVVEVPR